MKKKPFALMAMFAILITACTAIPGITPLKSADEAPAKPAVVEVTRVVEVSKVQVVTATPEADEAIASVEGEPVGSTVETVSVPEGAADVHDVVGQTTQGKWEVTFYEGVTDQMRGWFAELKDLAPTSWPEFPNVDNSRVGFKAANGLEYGLDERNYCPQETCDVVVAAGEYNLITADYDFGFIACQAGDGLGCAVMFINVGEVTANFEQVIVDNGFSVTGRYWNGDELEQGIWGGLSHAAANMMNLTTSLNPAGSTNAGANCSLRIGCTGVLTRVVITSGNQVLVVAETTVKQ